MCLRQTHEVADIESQDAAAVSSGLKQLLLVACVQGHPLARRPGHIMAALQQGLLQRTVGSVGIKM
jgi:hypothetical protein